MVCYERGLDSARSRIARALRSVLTAPYALGAMRRCRRRFVNPSVIGGASRRHMNFAVRINVLDDATIILARDLSLS